MNKATTKQNGILPTNKSSKISYWKATNGISDMPENALNVLLWTLDIHKIYRKQGWLLKQDQNTQKVKGNTNLIRWYKNWCDLSG